MMKIPWSILLALVALTASANAASLGGAEEEADDDCAIDFEYRMTLNETKEDCMRKHCYDELSDGKNCYREKSHPCFLPIPESRIYLNDSADCSMSHSCKDHDAVHAPGEDHLCFMKKTDACYIPDKEKRIPIEGAYTEEVCKRADGCYIKFPNGTVECYVKELKCVIIPKNCEWEEEVSECDRPCGAGIQMEKWRCCQMNEESCPADSTHAVRITVPRPCCSEPCPGSADSALVVDPTDLETTEMDPVEADADTVGAQLAYYHNPNITGIYKGRAILAKSGSDEKLFWPCAQVNAVDEACKTNNFYHIERNLRPDAEMFARKISEYFRHHPNLHLVPDNGQNNL